ncbi:helix-turn-helix domain-containing protein [Halolactibacillus alkaliphilus]
MLFEQGESAKDIAKEFNIGRSTVYKFLKESKTIQKEINTHDETIN